MNSDDKPEFANCMMGMFETYGRETTDAQLHGYWHGLRDLPLSAVQEAVCRAFRECARFPPTPAELRELAGESPAKAYAIEWRRKAKKSAAITLKDHRRRLEIRLAMSHVEPTPKLLPLASPDDV